MIKTTSYAEACETQSDINEHLPKLLELGVSCAPHATIVELGTGRGWSGLAFIYARPRKFVTVDIAPDQRVLSVLQSAANDLCVNMESITSDSTSMLPIPCEVLFIDTWHAGPQVFSELQNWAHVVRKYIAFHDTETFGTNGEGHPIGLLSGIASWLATPEGERWTLVEHRKNNNGLTIYRRKA